MTAGSSHLAVHPGEKSVWAVPNPVRRLGSSISSRLLILSRYEWFFFDIYEKLWHDPFSHLHCRSSNLLQKQLRCNNILNLISAICKYVDLNSRCPVSRCFSSTVLGLEHQFVQRSWARGNVYFVCFCLTWKNTSMWELVFLWSFLLFPYLLGEKPNFSVKWVVLTCSFGIFVSGGSSQRKISRQVSLMFYFPVDPWKRNGKCRVEAMLDSS